MAEQTISARVAEHQARSRDELSPEDRAVFEAEQALQRSRRPQGLPAIGSPFPAADLLDPHGNPTSVDAARDGRPAVIVFYRGTWCPYCNIALRTYQEMLVPALERMRVSFIAISPQLPDESLNTAEKNELSFAVLSDPGNALALRLGILTETGETATATQLSRGLDVSARNADGTHAVPMPTTVVIDADGGIVWLDAHPDYTTRSEVDDIVDAVTNRIGAPTER